MGTADRNEAVGQVGEAGGVDWYAQRDRLRVGMVFACRDGYIVRLDRTVPGDGTKWYVDDWTDRHGWSHYDSTIEPGDLIGQPGDSATAIEVVAALRAVGGAK